MNKYSGAAVILAVFSATAIGFWLATGHIFYLVNFLIIGTAVALGVGLYPVFPAKKKHIPRMTSQILVGGYIFFGLGLGFIYLLFGYISPENMQIEGFWLWLFSGAFSAGVIHYLVAKILGPLVFNRGWCGWACWTAAVLDLLPYKKSPGRLITKRLDMRLTIFLMGLLFMVALVHIYGFSVEQTVGVVSLGGRYRGEGLKYASLWQIPETWWFLSGNAAYFTLGILMAFILKDNRAFCKYICPITIFLKLTSRFSLLKVRADKARCLDCGLCDKSCPMDIRLTEYFKQDRRVVSSECILCLNCINACPRGALEITAGFDAGFREKLKTRGGQPMMKS